MERLVPLDLLGELGQHDRALVAVALEYDEVRGRWVEQRRDEVPCLPHCCTAEA